MAEGAPIIPISAQLKYNIEVVCEYIVKKIPVPVRDFTSEPRLIGKSLHHINLIFSITLALRGTCYMQSQYETRVPILQSFDPLMSTSLAVR